MDRQRREVEEGKLKAIQDETSRRIAEEEAEKQEKLRKAQARAKAMKNVSTNTFQLLFQSSHLNLRQPNKFLRISKDHKGDTGYGFTISGGVDVKAHPYVDYVDPFGPAAKHGLQKGDFIFTLNGQVGRNNNGFAFINIMAGL